MIGKLKFQIANDQLAQTTISKLLDDVGPGGTVPNLIATTKDNKPGKPWTF